MIKSTTVIAVRRNGQVAMAADGQVTLDTTILKGNAKKVRTLQDGSVIVGFAGATADAFTLFDRIEEKLKEFSGDLTRSAVELAKEWRTDRMLQKLQAMLLVANRERTYLISGTGDVVEPEHGVVAIGSGGNYAFAAALAYLDACDTMNSVNLSAKDIAIRSLGIASRICIYTNTHVTVEELA